MHVQQTTSAMSRDGVGGVLSTNRLWERPSREPDYAAEGHVAAAMVSQVAGSPDTLFRHAATVALDVCQAHSAGVALLVNTPDGDVFDRPAIAGAWGTHLHSTAPRDFSPYGVAVDSNAPQLFRRPERYYHYLQDIHPPVVEALLVPFETNHSTNGVLWVVLHDDDRTFDAEDVRRLTSLARCATTVHQVAASVRRLADGGAAAERLGIDLLQLHSVLSAMPTPAFRSRRRTGTRLGLSRREYEVVRLVARGHTNKAIGETLGVNVKTVETYRARATDKLGLRNRADFVTYASSQGWLKGV